MDEAHSLGAPSKGDIVRVTAECSYRDMVGEVLAAFPEKNLIAVRYEGIDYIRLRPTSVEVVKVAKKEPTMTRQEQLARELRAWADWCESSVDTVDARPARPHHVVLREAAAALDFPSIVEDGPHFDEHFRKKIDVYADKHPTAVVRQLATRLRAAWATLAQAAPMNEDGA